MGGGRPYSRSSTYCGKNCSRSIRATSGKCTTIHDITIHDTTDQVSKTLQVNANGKTNAESIRISKGLLKKSIDLADSFIKILRQLNINVKDPRFKTHQKNRKYFSEIKSDTEFLNKVLDLLDEYVEKLNKEDIYAIIKNKTSFSELWKNLDVYKNFIRKRSTVPYELSEKIVDLLYKINDLGHLDEPVIT